MRDKKDKLEPDHVVTGPVLSPLTLMVSVWLSLSDWLPRLSRRPPSPSDAERWPVTSGDQAGPRGQDGGGHMYHSQPIIRGHGPSLRFTPGLSHQAVGAGVTGHTQASSEGQVIIAKLF